MLILLIYIAGLMNGRFLKRGKIKKPPEMQSSDMRLDSLFYGPEDLYVGAIVEFNKHTFLLTSADDYVFAYMERPSEIEMVNGFSKFNFFQSEITDFSLMKKSNFSSFLVSSIQS